MTFSVTLTNRFDYNLHINVARLKLPDGTSYKSADSGGRLTAFGEATWDIFDLPARGTVGPPLRSAPGRYVTCAGAVGVAHQ